jgi:hypothetical protein
LALEAILLERSLFANPFSIRMAVVCKAGDALLAETGFAK